MRGCEAAAAADAAAAVSSSLASLLTELGRLAWTTGAMFRADAGRDGEDRDNDDDNDDDDDDDAVTTGGDETSG